METTEVLAFLWAPPRTTVGVAHGEAEVGLGAFSLPVSPASVQKAVGGKKDRSLFLFTDLLVCTRLKRKSGSLRRSSMSL